MVRFHPSIVQPGGQFEIQSSNVNQTLFHCLLCPKFKLTTSRRIQRHMDGHINTALQVDGNLICRCNQPCRPAGHYHCPYCGKTILRKEHMETHVHGCHFKPSQPETLAQPSSPLSASQLHISPSYDVSPTTSLVLASHPATSTIRSSPSPTSAASPSLPTTLSVPCSPPTLAVASSIPLTSEVPLSPPTTGTPTSPPLTLVVAPSPSKTSTVSLSSPVKLAVHTLEPDLMPLDLQDPMECNASVVDQDHCYTLPFPVSHDSPIASPVSSDILSSSQPEASTTDVCSPDTSLKAGPVPDDITELPSHGVRRLKLVQCSHCSLRLYKKNLGAHMQRKHGGPKDVTAASHLKNVCVDETHGIFAVQKVSHGFSVPIHVQRKTWGNHHRIKCGLEECHKYQLLTKQNGLIYSLCEHIRSVDYCRKIAHEEFLKTDFLEELVSMHIVEESMMENCKMRQNAARKDHVPFSVFVDLGGSTHQLCLSVHEPNTQRLSCFGRVIVTYNLKKQSWYCPCTNPREFCPHKSIGKWHIFQTRRDLLPAQGQDISASYTHDPTPELERIVRYTYTQKKIPAALPRDITAPRALTDYPVCLIPTEETCKLCQGHPRLEEGFLITDKAVIVSMSGVKHNISTFNKICPDCNMHYRYQEWGDGLHNFNDHVILTLELCLYLRHGLQSHMSVCRIISSLESFRGQKFPVVSIIFQAYCHFEALTNTEYNYSCVKCGSFPPVVIMDVHSNRISKLEVSELNTPPENFDGLHNVEDFWDSVHLEMISQGFFPKYSANPFQVRPCFERWAPWIGKETRKTNSVLNTEFKKMQISEGELTSVTVDKLCDELLKQNDETLQSLCKRCNVETSGSRTDLIIQLRAKMTDQQTYDKVYKAVWGTSRRWSVVACPHGIVYSLKFNLQTEGARDFTDLLLSWKHFPNICLYHSPHSLATHTNLRAPDNPPFHPHEGKASAPTQENLRHAVCGKLKVSLPWLRERCELSEKNGHPVTGSNHHYALYNKLNERNTQDPHAVLRMINLVPELQDIVKSKAVKHLLGDMRKNNYFLNSLAPSTHIFLVRNLVEHRNAICNTQLLETHLK
ncbi:HMG domain-containing protein 3 HMG box-containing protein 3 Protein SMF [Channa argus]|uniref:HMG domain-containing protein 3 HMG box-containing protein 3 Protein SMF n=1 Tax=Channa argus TaxID=215402 RepID=A0A6G1QCE4_CHAAH|nr:HMG domain-containing protein 3 HMG box-containing protein 3 Protein SMF [Channa argus]KAK2893600.1 hypothetical protein Q8A73_016084 [Channa argus]